MLAILNPARGDLLREVSDDDREVIEAKVYRARKAQMAWNACALDERKKIIKRFATALKQKTPELSRTLTLEMGKPIAQARAEIESCASRLQFFLDHID